MKFREIAVTEAMRGADVFLDGHYSVLADGNAEDVARARRKVAEVLADLRQLAVDQDGGWRGFKGEAAKQKKLRADLCKDWLKPIARIARRKLRQVPEYKSLEMPEKGLPLHGFIASARGMCSTAAEHREALIAYGLPESYVQDLNAAIDAFEAAIGNRDGHLVSRASATKGLETATSEARTVLSVLDARMRQWAKGDEALLAEWKGARHIRQRPGPVSSRGASPPATGSDGASAPDQPPGTE
jgi:hypothetical protein